MTRFAKIATIAVVLLILAAISLVVAAMLHNWNLERQVRAAFALTGKHVEAQEIQEYLEKKFPVGTRQSEIAQFISLHFRTPPDYTAVASLNKQAISYMIDCGSRQLGTQDRIQLEFIFSENDNALQEIKVYDRSIAL